MWSHSNLSDYVRLQDTQLTHSASKIMCEGGEALGASVDLAHGTISEMQSSNPSLGSLLQPAVSLAFFLIIISQ